MGDHGFGYEKRFQNKDRQSLHQPSVSVWAVLISNPFSASETVTENRAACLGLAAPQTWLGQQ